MFILALYKLIYLLTYLLKIHSKQSNSQMFILVPEFIYVLTSNTVKLNSKRILNRISINHSQTVTTVTVRHAVVYRRSRYALHNDAFAGLASSQHTRSAIRLSMQTSCVETGCESTRCAVAVSVALTVTARGQASSGGKRILYAARGLQAYCIVLVRCGLLWQGPRQTVIALSSDYRVLMPLEHLKQAMIDITISIRPILRAETQHIMINRMLLLSQLTTSYIINNITIGCSGQLWSVVVS